MGTGEINNYTKINNDILDALIKANLNGTQLAISLFIYRKTIGWNKKTDNISLSQFMKYIPVSKPSICKALDHIKLVKICLLVKKSKRPNCSNEWAFNDNIESWQLVKKTLLVKKSRLTSKEIDVLLVKKPLHTKETITKDINKRNISKDIQRKIDNFLFEEEFEFLWNKYPKKLGKKKAVSHFKASVSNEQDLKDIDKALNNYLDEIKYKKIQEDYIKHGSTWFNQWRDYLMYTFKKSNFDWDPDEIIKRNGWDKIDLSVLKKED